MYVYVFIIEIQLKLDVNALLFLPCTVYVSVYVCLMTHKDTCKFKSFIFFYIFERMT